MICWREKKKERRKRRGGGRERKGREEQGESATEETTTEVSGNVSRHHVTSIDRVGHEKKFSGKREEKEDSLLWTSQRGEKHSGAKREHLSREKDCHPLLVKRVRKKKKVPS